MLQNKGEILYILGAMALLGVLGIYLAINQIDAFSNLFRMPFVRNNSKIQVTESVKVSVSPSSSTSVAPTPEQGQKSPKQIAEVDTNRGKFEIVLLEENAPNTTSNFITLSQNGYYDGTSFHRFIPNLLLQGGSRNTINKDPSDDNFGGPGYVIPDEINWNSLGLSQERMDELGNLGFTSNENVKSVKMEKYYVAMASDGPNRAGSQFFVILTKSGDDKLVEMEGKFTVFGFIEDGRKVINEVADGGIDLTDLQNPRPKKGLTIKSITIKNI